MSRKKSHIVIHPDDLTFIFNNQVHDFYAYTNRCFCAHCRKGYNSTITHYTIFLNNLYDIELHGFCAECNYKMNRYIETGENPLTARNAEAVWKTNKALNELKIKKEK